MVRFIIYFCMILVSCNKRDVLRDKTNIVSLSLSSDPSSLDPRKARDLSSGIVIRILFEGLMRTGNDGTLEMGVANDVKISEDGQSYRFSLKKMNWSNGSPLTAHDFVFSWKSLLDPNFPSDTAYCLYPIKNGKKAKLGEVSIDSIGVHAVDEQTLLVELEKPTPYFLSLLTMPVYFPVCEKAVSETWAQEASTLVSNGPFQLETWSHSEELISKKNPHYWDSQNVQIDGVDLLVLSEETGFRFFEENRLDWIGSPLSTIPKDAMDGIQKEGKIERAPFLATQICRVNTGLEGPLSNPKFRRALALSMDRKGIVEHVLNGGQEVATGFVPPVIGGKKEGFFPDHAFEEARLILEELQIESPTIVLSYYNSERNRLLAQTLAEQWEKNLGIQVTLDAVEPKVYFQKISKKEFQLAIGSWVADFADPINFLEVFKTKDCGTNNTCWERDTYIDLLNRSEVCRDLTARMELLAQAEKVLMDEMPLIPIYFFVQNYMKNDALVGAFVTPEGHLNLRNASFQLE